MLAGVSLGLVATAAVGALTFKLEQRLPYKRMLVVTGVLIALVLVVLVGNTMRTMQGIGWLSITPIDVEFPLWMGTWLGVFPTVETLLAQAAALAFVIGSYYAAEWYRKRRVRRAAREHRPAEPSPMPAAPSPSPATAGARSRAGRRRATIPAVSGQPDSDELDRLFDTVVGTVTLRASDLGRVARVLRAGDRAPGARNRPVLRRRPRGRRGAHADPARRLFRAGV